MKTKEELNELKIEIETLKGKLAELSEEELAEVVGGNEQAADEFTGKTKIPGYGNWDDHQ